MSLSLVAGFLLGAVAVLGMTTTLIANQLLLERIGGVITILMGLVFIGFVPPLWEADLVTQVVERAADAGGSETIEGDAALRVEPRTHGDGDSRRGERSARENLKSGHRTH